jgi:hypothetical protein
MHGRAFIDLAPDILAGNTEAHRRGTVGRAYYGLMLECRDALSRWGFKLPPRDNVHTFVRLRFDYAAHPDLKSIGWDLEQLGRLRNRADYDLSALVEFASNSPAQQGIDDARAALVLLDAIEVDPARPAAATDALLLPRPDHPAAEAIPIAPTRPHPRFSPTRFIHRAEHREPEGSHYVSRCSARRIKRSRFGGACSSHIMGPHGAKH